VEPISSIYDETAPVTFRGWFCFTGTSKSYSRRELHALIQTAGGMPSEKVTTVLNYLVVCGQGNRAWSFSNYGQKICARP
jgi:NAD-dependent DNA ligase